MVKRSFLALPAAASALVLTAWLIEAHNYPELMDFELSEAEAREVAEYMLSLQSEDYEPGL
ncbi:MAG: hypothetical protein AAF559_04830 [Pseudomonadota bacterium]